MWNLSQHSVIVSSWLVDYAVNISKRNSAVQILVYTQWVAWWRESSRDWRAVSGRVYCIHVFLWRTIKRISKIAKTSWWEDVVVKHSVQASCSNASGKHWVPRVWASSKDWRSGCVVASVNILVVSKKFCLHREEVVAVIWSHQFALLAPASSTNRLALLGVVFPSIRPWGPSVPE